MNSSYKESLYQETLKQVRSVLTAEDNNISNLANFCAIIKQNFDHHWVGFYLVDEFNKKLILGPFQGPLACTQIPFGKGVCGKSWQQGKTIVVDDVHQFDGHIACSTFSNSEIVVPLSKDQKIWAVLDIDSVEFKAFDELDQKYLELMMQHLSIIWKE